MRAALLACIAALVAAIATAQQPPQITLHLSDGSVIVGVITTEADGVVTIETQHLGILKIGAAMIVDRVAGTPLDAPEAKPVAPPPTPPTPTTAPTVNWTRTFGIGGSYASAPYEQGELEGTIHGISGKALQLAGTQINTQLTASFLRTGPKSAWHTTGSVTYVDAKPAGKLTEAYVAQTDYMLNIRPRTYLFSETSFKRDEVRRIDDSVVQMVGIGRRIIDRPNLKAHFLPGVLLQRQESGTRYDREILGGYGFLQTVDFNTARGVALEERIALRTLFHDPGIWAGEAYGGIRAPVSHHLSLTVGVTVKHDEMLGLQATTIPANALYPGSPAAQLFANKRTTVDLTTGLQVRY